MEDSTEKAAEEMTKAMEKTAEAIEDAAEDMANAIEEATRGMRDAIETMSGEVVTAIEDMAQDIVDAIDDMVEKINEKLEEIPDKINFDVIGILHMPSIPKISTIFFDIFGRYHAPSIPSAQVGIPYIPRTMPVVVHKKEAILTAPQAEQWRRGKEAGGEITHNYYQNVEIKSLIPPDDSVLYRNLWREHMKMAHDEEEARRAV